VLAIVISAIVFAFVVTVVVMFLVTKVVEDRAARTAFFITGAITPILLVVATVRTVMRRHREVPPCPQFLANVEKEIEQERIEVFGGSRLIPPLAAAWQAAYLQSLQRTASKVSKVGSVFSALTSSQKDQPVAPVHVG